MKEKTNMLMTSFLKQGHNFHQYLFLNKTNCMNFWLTCASTLSQNFRVNIPNNCKFIVPKLQNVGFSSPSKSDEVLSFNIFRENHVCPITCAFKPISWKWVENIYFKN